MVQLLLALLLAGQAHAGPHRDAVLDLLNAFEGAPTADQLRAVDPGVDAELREIADDDSVPTSRRGRAVSALGYFPSDPNRAFLGAHLTAADRPLLRRKAAMAMAMAFQAEAVDALSPHLADDDAQVRAAVARALASIDAEPAREALRARLSVETEPSVRAVIAGAVGGGE